MNPIALAAFSGWALIAMIALLWGEIVFALVVICAAAMLIVRLIAICALYLWAWCARKTKAV